MITSAGENASVAGALVNDLLMGPRDGKIKPSKFEEFCWESAWMEHKMLDVATIIIWVFPKIGVPKMDGYNGKPY